ncbi:uncharacterized protein EKO05_0002266 [Ascochyta rabiei]|uniref:Probable beta-glucosidase btgE n=1 Tax=Didymella rabiei TaxID=5454 RepID=A0A163KT48_DIDRA|nr:uncharacterized protein EKO05_0002266 [Ascochyta rabiei]KZM27230.1 carbohydrate metabolic process [Ascochyta rabiei]UPX11672.1 hypothetical protein EKO05_0002266 [Ascochyta rabiei]
MKASIVAAAALVASVAAFEHKNHAGFHMRRGAYEPKDEVCTVYTTVYVHALPSIVPNTTTIYEHSTPAAETSTSCTEGDKASSIYTPIVISTKTPEASQPAYPTVPVVPESSKPAVPVSSAPVVPASSAPVVPASSAPVVSASSAPVAPVSSAPAVPEYPTKPAVPKPSKGVYPSAPIAESSKPAPQPSKPATSEYPTKPVDTPKPAPSSSKAVDTPKPAPSSSKAADKPKPTGSYSSGGRIVTNGDKWAMTYTPYAPDGNCKTEADIKSDIKIIADLGFTTIRSYSTDCGVFEYVVPACQEHGLKIIYGIFLEAGGSGGKGPFSQYANDQLDDIKNNAPKDGVAMVIVGNECMFNNNCAPAELASYIDHVREQLQGAGFPKDIAITTTEPVGTWEEKGAALCDHIDVFTVQVHPYFTASISPDMAGDFAAQQLEQAAKVCPEAAAKGKYISEIGWPSAGNNNGKAVAGVAEQKEAMKKIMEKVGAEACLFSFKDDPWKHPGALGVEQHFGCIDALS